MKPIKPISFTHYFLLVLLCSLSSCNKDYGQLTLVADLPKSMEESSGIQIINDTEQIWMVNDSGNKNELYALNDKGKITKTVIIEGAEDVDWEELTKDDQGNIYIGDIGNNKSRRKDLKVYKLPNPDHFKDGEKVKPEVINFSYPEQNDFKPGRKGRLYDAESLFYFKGNLYLLTKNRSSDFDGTTFVYQFPAQPGTYKAKRITSYKTCSNYHACQVTSAALSPDQKTLVLLGYQKLWVFTNFKGNDFFNGDMRTIAFNHYSQKEAVTFINASELYIIDERDHQVGGHLYKIDINQAK
ncbi:hypothetical protein ACG2LH_09385 [Zhouia sp. PK063]|uniref:hypothetical protein n=1 Tax=Zhouia sp. PK063 TaxID=3373602 RepID=UPI0037A803AD